MRLNSPILPKIKLNKGEQGCGEQNFSSCTLHDKRRKREEFYKKVLEQGIVEASKKETGNLKYDYYYPLDSANDICLLEIWKNKEEQKKHSATSHYQLLTELKKEYVLDVKIQCYPIVEEEK